MVEEKRFILFLVIVLMLRLEYGTGGYNSGVSSQVQTNKHDDAPGMTTRSMQRLTFGSVKIGTLLPGTERRK